MLLRLRIVDQFWVDLNIFDPNCEIRQLFALQLCKIFHLFVYQIFFKMVKLHNFSAKLC